MEAVTFTTLPAEIHVSIAKYCQNNDLINLCLTSTLMHERCLHVLYRDVDLQYHRHGLSTSNNRDGHLTSFTQVGRDVQFCFTLLRNPEYAKNVRFLKKNFYAPIDVHSERAMQLVTHVRSVDIAFENFASFPPKRFPGRLFQSVTAVRLVGEIQYSLAKSILNAINPAALEHLCLDLVPDLRIGSPPRRFVPQDKGENGRIIAFAVVQGLLTPLAGRFTALRTLILRRIAKKNKVEVAGHATAEEESYIEWAAFIRSVQGTVEKFIFEQLSGLLWRSHSLSVFTPEFEIMDERFRRLILPIIVSENWPCLNNIELRGIRSSNGQGELAKELKAVLGEKAKIVVNEEPDTLEDYVMPYCWR